MKRVLTLTAAFIECFDESMSSTSTSVVFGFDSERMKDSEALHYVLCMNSPSEDYSVSFRNLLVSRETITCQCENSQCGHTKENQMCGKIADDSERRIVFLGNVCEDCFSKYPEHMRL